MFPLLRAGLAFAAVLKLALAADTISTLIVEVIDNAIMLQIPGAMDTGLDDLPFWGSLAVLGIAAAFAIPVTRWLISRDKGYAVVHAHHGRHPLASARASIRVRDPPPRFRVLNRYRLVPEIAQPSD